MKRLNEEIISTEVKFISCNGLFLVNCRVDNTWPTFRINNKKGMGWLARS